MVSHDVPIKSNERLNEYLDCLLSGSKLFHWSTRIHLATA
jgi:hypothetical protein